MIQKKTKIYAIYQRGIYIIDCKNESSSLVEIMPEEKSYDLLITSVLKKGNSYWLATNKGLLSYNINSNSLTSFSRRAGLSSNIVLSVIASNNDLWLSTQNGLVQFNPKSFKATNYHVSEGLITNEFNIWSYLKSRSGNMFFGGPQGIIGFNPENFDMPEGKEGALQLSRITSLNKHNKVIRTFSKPDNLSQKIKFSAKEKNLSFKVFNSAFDDQQQRNYMYFLEGLETNWINNGNNAEIKFSHPPPGKYTLRVKSTGPNKLEPSSEIAFPVIILNNGINAGGQLAFT